MSRLVLLLAALWTAGAAAEPALAAWYPVESPTTAGLTTIHFSPDGTGWAVGEAGTVLRYDGKRWQRIPGPNDAIRFLHVAALGPEELWASETGMPILHHYQQGRWSSVRLEGQGGLWLGFHTPQLGYAAGLFGMLYQYDGKSWSRVQTPVLVNDRESHLDAVAVLAPDDVWVGGGSGDFVLHFDGRQWQRIYPRPRGGTGRLRRMGDTVVLLDAPVLVRRAGAWEPMASVTLSALATHGGTAWGILFMEGKLVRLTPSKVEPVTTQRRMADLAESPEGLWAVGEGGLILHLERRRLPTFVDRTFEAGVGVLSSSTATVLAELDDQGGADLLLAAPFGRHSFLRAEAPGEFRSQPLALPRLEQLPKATSLAVADLDGDGRQDLVLRPGGKAGAQPLHVLRNLGDWRFLEGGPAAAPLPAEDASLYGQVQIGDLDGDGDLDVYETRYLREPVGRPIPNVLWRNDGLGRLIPEALAHHDGGASLSWSGSALLADLNEDGRTDVLSLNHWGRGNELFRQTGDGALVNASQGSGLQGEFGMMPTVATVGDVNGDGARDLLVLSAPGFSPSRLYRNVGGHFRDVTSELGLDALVSFSYRSELADLDLDGDLDLALISWPIGVSASPPYTQLLLNDGQGHFTDVTAQAGVKALAADLLVEDFDGDGDLDLYLVREGESNRLMINEAPAQGWLKVRLEAAPPNRAALGAKVRVHGPDGALLGMRETYWRKPVAHFGLGEAQAVTVEVRFPSGKVVRREGVAPGQVLEVAESSRPELWLRGAAFLLRHRWAWADHEREGWKLALALAWVLGLRKAGRALGARQWMGRTRVAIGLLGLYAALVVACVPLAPVSRLAAALPLVSVGLLGAGVLGVDLLRSRRAEARFVGPYELMGVLGQGGMGIVYRARDSSQPGRPVVALKVLRPERVGDPASLKRFMREAELGARLSHPGIVSVQASGECRVLEGRVWRTTAYLAMECVEGTSLAALLAGGERLPLVRAVEILRDAAEALAVAHAVGVLHRDVKPDNLLVSRAGQVKLVDFGIAAVARGSTRTEAGLLVGTLAYLPPERVAGKQEDARGDLYSLGAVLYEAVCGRPPFVEKETASLLAAVVSTPPVAPRVLRPELPERLEALLLSLLSKDPAGRPDSARQVVEALSAALRELAGPRETVPPPQLVPQEPPPAPQPPRASRAPERETLELPPPHGGVANR
jgi:serine/threonine protein kinase